eukprot:CAMPEP_0119307694 /NCGR_PEP_ID=MMETSP1333-20130426/8108_1 /TAXON_ID=418940 /ORGANISM="Scyphosphaera apsteinii, Strain RCC1455" /LENGTH=461 /DNA_ID=CAMNT_0007311289 /DNA_START=156 /DNA_END=1542 /DNA_ORIENTATION=-
MSDCCMRTCAKRNANSTKNAEHADLAQRSSATTANDLLLNTSAGIDQMAASTSLDVEIARLEAQLAQLHAKHAAIAPDNPADVPFKPIGERPCGGVLPCLHSSPAERLGRRCDDELWHGHWALTPKANQSQLRSKEWYETPTGQEWSVATTDCDLANPFSLSPLASRGSSHVTVATEQHAFLRLQGVRGRLWLMFGTSVDHMTLSAACLRFGATKQLSHLEGTTMMPWCHLSPLNLTLAEFSGHGLTAEAWTRSEKTIREHYQLIQRHLRINVGWSTGPDILTFAGVEWDFKTWDRPGTARKELLDVVPKLIKLIGTAFAFWPSLVSISLRPSPMSTYKGFDLSSSVQQVDERLALYALYTARLREVAAAMLLPLVAGICQRRVHVLDLPRMMHCQVCSRSSGWTKDGLHPVGWVHAAYFSAALNIFSDYITECAQRGTSFQWQGHTIQPGWAIQGVLQVN